MDKAEIEYCKEDGCSCASVTFENNKYHIQNGNILILLMGSWVNLATYKEEPKTIRQLVNIIIKDSKYE